MCFGFCCVFFNLHEIIKHAVPNDRTVSKELEQIQHGPQIRTELSDKLHSQRFNSLKSFVVSEFF